MKQPPPASGLTSTQAGSAEMTAALDGMIRRVRRLIVLRGLSLVILTWLAGLAIAMTIDGYWVIYAMWARWGLALITYGPAAAVAIGSLLRPLSQTLTPAGLARAIERRHPELHERISSAVELTASADTPEERGSDALIRALGDAAAADIRRVDPRVEISIRKVARYLAGSAAALAAVVAVSLIWPSTAGRLALRSALPILNLPNIHAGNLTVEPGDAVILRGDRLRVLLTATRADLPDARLMLDHPEGRRETLAMNRIPEGEAGAARFSVVTEPLQTNVQYRIRAGDAVTRVYQVAVTPRPGVEHLDITYHYPAYTGREADRTRVVHGDIRAVAGTEILVRAAFNKRLDQVTLFIDGDPVANTASDDQAPTDDPAPVRLRQPEPDVAVFRLTLDPGLQSVWKIEGTDHYGFSGGTRDVLLQAVADAVPEVRITQPADDRLTLRATDRLVLDYTISDDFGIGLAGLILEADGRPLPIHPLPPSEAGGGNRNLRGALTLDFSEWPLQQTRRLALQLRARDHRSTALGGPQVGKSRILMIELDDQARPYRQQVLDHHTQQVRQSLTATRKEIDQARASLTHLDRTLANPRSPDNAVTEGTKRVLTDLETVDHALETASKLMQDGFYDGLRQPLATDAGDPVMQAAETLSMIPITDDRDRQSTMTAGAGVNLERADRALESMLDELEAMHPVLDHAVATRELADRQADLAAGMAADARPTTPPATPSENDLAQALLPDTESTPVDGSGQPDTQAAEETLDRLREQQQHLVDDLADMIRDFPDAARIAAATTREDIERLSDETDELLARHEAERVRRDEAGRMKDDWETAADELTSQFAALSDANRELVLPRRDVPLDQIANDLDAGRLRQAAESIDEVAAELGRRRETIEREQHTADLADRVRQALEDPASPLRRLADAPRTEAASPADDPDDDPAALAALADRLDELAGDAGQATPLAQQAFELYNPADELRTAMAAADMPDDDPVNPEHVMETARDKADRLQVALDAAARAAQAERLAERMNTVADEIATMDRLLDRSTELAQQLTDTLEPWQQALDATATQAARQAETAQRHRDAVSPDAGDLLDAMDANPVAAGARTEALQQALTPPPDPAAATDTPPSAATQAQQANQAAREARRAADAVETAARQAREHADADVQRAREALDEMAGMADADVQREARWRLEEAEEARERDRRRADDADATAQRLKRMADELDAIARDFQAADTQQAGIEADRKRMTEAQALAESAAHRAESAERALDRLTASHARLLDQQQALLAENRDSLADDADALARWETEKSRPAAADTLQALSDSAGELAQRQTALADAIADARETQDELRRQADAMRQADETDPRTERALMDQAQALETEMAQLAETQKDLAHEARQLKREAAEATANSRPLPLPQPEQPMERTARALQSAAADTAQAAAQQAADQQAQLAEALADRAATMPPDPRMAATPPPAAPTSPASPASPAAPAAPASTPAPPPTPSPAPPSSPEQPASPSQASPSAPGQPPTPSQASSPEPPPAPATSPTPETAMPASDNPPALDIPPAQQAAFDWADAERELIGEELIPETDIIPNLGIDQDGVEWDLGHAHERPDSPLPDDVDLGDPATADSPLQTDFAGAPDVPVPPVPQAPKKEAMSGPVPFSDPVSMTAPVTELPKIIMPDRFPQTFAGKFSDAPIPPPPAEKSSSLAPAPRLTESDLDAAKKEFAELSAIHIDDAPNSSDMGGQATEELPSEMLFEPGAQYSKGAPGQSAMPGMELGQLSQAENQDQQSQSPAQPPMPSAGGSGGGDKNSPSQSSASKSAGQPTPSQSTSSGSQSGSSSGSTGGTSDQPAEPPPTPQQAGQNPSPGADPATGTPSGQTPTATPADPAIPPGQRSQSTAQPDATGQPGPGMPVAGSANPSTAAALDDLQASAESERIRAIEDRLGSRSQPLESLPDHAGWRDAPTAATIAPETVGRLSGHLRQTAGLAAQLLPEGQHLNLPPQPRGGQEGLVDGADLLPWLAAQAHALRDGFQVDPDTRPLESAADQQALAEALHYAGRAALSGDPRDAETAAQRMAVTARKAQRRAEAMGLSVNPHPVKPAADDDQQATAMRRLGLPVSDWLRLPGELRSEVLQASPAEGPEEYRGLIRRYFSDIAREHPEE